MNIYAKLLGLVSAGLLASTGFSSTAGAEDTLAKLKAQGFARIAIANEPPFTSVSSDGKVSGAGPDVARAVFSKLGVPDIVASISEYGAMIPGLQAGRFDAVTAGLFMRPERCSAVAYSEPILCDTLAFAVKKGNPLKLTKFEDVAASTSARVGVVGGGIDEKLALAAGIPRDRVIVVPDYQSGIKLLQTDRIDVYALPILSLNDVLAKVGDPNIVSTGPVAGAPVSCDGAAFRKEDSALRDAFDVELAKLKKSGEFAKLVEPYGFSAAAAMSTNREQLCSAK
jgi:polar amino acid transport system substrate-binding protein